MNKFVTAILILLTGWAWASNLTSIGGLNSSNGDYESIHVTGPTSITNFKFSNGVFTGPMKLANSNVGIVHVTGPATCYNSTIDTLFVTGPGYIKQSTVDSIQATTTHLVIESSEIKNNITINSGRNWFAQTNEAIIDIKGDSQILGKITFNSGNGIVNVYGNAPVPENIQGGKIVFFQSSESLQQ